jgi:hypothetical protein
MQTQVSITELKSVHRATSFRSIEIKKYRVFGTTKMVGVGSAQTALFQNYWAQTLAGSSTECMYN